MGARKDAMRMNLGGRGREVIPAPFLSEDTMVFVVIRGSSFAFA